MSDLLNMTERTNERIASLGAQIEELRLLMLKNMENDNSFLSENVEPLPIGGEGGGGVSLPECYDISSGDDTTVPPTDPGTLINCFVFTGSVCLPGPSENVCDYSNKIIALVADNDTGYVTIASYANMTELFNSQKGGNVAIVPLYKMGTCDPDAKTFTVLTDFRRMPHLDTWTFYG